MAKTSLRIRRLRARGISPRLAKLWGNRVFMGTGATRGVYVSPQGYTVVSKSVQALVAQPRFGVVVAGVNTPASVTVAGLDVTFNSATNASSVATSTALDAVRAVQANPAAQKLVSIETHKRAIAEVQVVQARALTVLAPNQP